MLLAIEYAAIGERVRDHDNGLLFRDAAGLADTLKRLPADGGRETFGRLRAASARMGQERWLDWWTREAAPTLGL
jgi:hypothetical protein